MPIIRAGRFVADDWVRPSEDGSPPASGKILLPPDRLAAEGSDLMARGHAVGAEVANNAAPSALEAWLGKLSLIAIAFPKHADGRGFTLAQRLRRLGFAGELRAVGHLIPDQYALALSCGFDSVEISPALAERQPEAHWREAEHAMTLAYQRQAGAQRSIMAARWTAN